LPATVHSRASTLAARERVAERIAELRAIAAKQNELGVAELLRMHVEIATADARELVEYRRIPCRHCHGQDHRYQFTPAEMERAREKHDEKQAEAKNPKPFDEKGGVGYTKKRAPHPDCPECHGDGLGEMLVSDTRKLSRVGAQLYEGVKLGKEGLEVKTRSRGDSLAAIGRHRGFFKEDNKVEVSVFDAETLEAKYRAGIDKSMERQAAIVAARRKARESR
jgi:phage terminase small subunit